MILRLAHAGRALNIYRASRRGAKRWERRGREHREEHHGL
jgi:hypothetical protein